jgi:hypothetical protein
MQITYVLSASTKWFFGSPTEFVEDSLLDILALNASVLQKLRPMFQYSIIKK